MKNTNLSDNTLHLLKAFMASHAVFNALTYVQHQIADDEKRAALKALSVFANFIRKTADDVESHTRTAEKEMEMLKLYCQLEQWRFAERLTIEIDTQYSLLAKIPCFLIVPFAEQIILMGLMSDTENLLLKFSFIENKKLVVNCNFDLNPSFLSSLNAEQKNRADLLTERLEIYSATYDISTNYTKQEAILQIETKL